MVATNFLAMKIQQLKSVYVDGLSPVVPQSVFALSRLVTIIVLVLIALVITNFDRVHI
jgi:hypothetical protein